MPLTNAEKQRRWRERRAAGTPVVRYVKAAEPKRSRPERWRAAVATLRELQESYQTWRDNLPESLEDSATAELLDAVIAVDLDQLDIGVAEGIREGLRRFRSERRTAGSRLRRRQQA